MIQAGSGLLLPISAVLAIIPIHMTQHRAQGLHGLTFKPQDKDLSSETPVLRML